MKKGERDEAIQIHSKIDYKCISKKNNKETNEAIQFLK